METQRIEFDRDQALQLWRKYQSHRVHQTPVDIEIERLAKLIASGKVVIRALASIREAGLGDDKLPKLAIARADTKWCFLQVYRDGSGLMDDDGNGGWRRKAATKFERFAAGSFDGAKVGSFRAMVPHIPPDIRPKRGLQNYHILFEADWTMAPPVDPLLLRRIGRDGDAWIVVAAWDLTPIERAVMAGIRRPS